MSKWEVERRRRYRRGHSAEWIAAAYFAARGYRILARRFKTPHGEIDLIVRKGRRIAFIEVKRRSTRQECEASITPNLRRRVRSAADLWLARRPEYHECATSFDLVFITPWRWPQHMPNSL